MAARREPGDNLDCTERSASTSGPRASYLGAVSTHDFNASPWLCPAVMDARV